MVLSAEKHTTNKVGSRDTRSALDDLETTSSLDEAVAVISIGIGSNVVSVNNVFAAVMRYPGQVSHIRSVGNTLSRPATSVDSRDTVKQKKSKILAN